MTTEAEKVFSDLEYAVLIAGACVAGPHTQEQVFRLVKHAERVRIEGRMLEAVLRGEMLLWMNDWEIGFSPNDTGEDFRARLDAMDKDGSLAAGIQAEMAKMKEEEAAKNEGGVK